MFETYRLLGEERELELLREARRLDAGHGRTARQDSAYAAASASIRLRQAADWQSWPSTPPSARSSGLQFGTDTGRAPTSSEWPAVAEQIIEAITS